MSKPIREVIDKIPIAEVIEMKEFNKLEIFKGNEGTDWKSYWEITFECEQRGDGGLWRTPWGQIIPHKFYKVYKLKQ